MAHKPSKADTKDETHSDAWARFERAVDVVAKSPPQHRMKPKTKGRAHAKAKAKKTADDSRDH